MKHGLPAGFANGPVRLTSDSQPAARIEEE